MRLSPTRWIAMAACTVAVVATQPPATAQLVATDQECEDHWKSSYAASSCGSASENPNGTGWVVYTSQYYAKAAGGANCHVVVDCATEDHPDEEPVENDVLINLPNFMTLYNCDGKLTHSSC